MRTRVLFMVLVLFGLGHVLQVRADDFMQNKMNYSAMIMGVDKIRFTLPTQYDGSFNEGISEGHIYLVVDGGSRQSLFDWNCVDYSELTDDKESGKCNIHAYQGGTFQLVGKVKNGYKSFTSESNTVSYTLGYNDDNDDHFTTTVDWVVPRSLRGHSLKIEMWVHIEDRDRNWYIPVDNKNKSSFHTLAEWNCPDAPEVSISLGEPMLAFDTEHVNQQMLTYSVTARSVKWAKLYYTDALTGQNFSQDLPINSLVGIAYIPADRPWKDIYVEARVIDTEGKEVNENVRSELTTTRMIHYPDGLRVKYDSEGNALLSWSISNADMEDITDGDYFEIQRNTTGSTLRTDPNWFTVSASMRYEQGKQNYTFKDETVLNQYAGNPIAYRIRRVYTSMWQWADNSGFAVYQIPDILALPSISNATVNRTDAWNDEQHVVNITFDNSSNVKSIQGRFVISNERELKQFEEHNTDYSKALFCIGSIEDWERVCNMVSQGHTNLHVIMTNDVSLGATASSSSQAKIGTKEHPFTGEFDGNGHTLTINYWKKDVMTAPFMHISGATIKNLRVKGSITSTTKFSGGLVGAATGMRNIINGCWVSVSISASINGDSSYGGFVGSVGAERGSLSSSEITGELEMNNCRFDGTMTNVYGWKSYANGGMIGWIGSASSKATLNSCIFAPEYIYTDTRDCSTFARCSDTDASLKLNNCFFTSYYSDKELQVTKRDGKDFYVINSATDWERFVAKVQEAAGNADVNAVLAADIATSTPCGMDAWPYRGTFDGNGHILDVNILWDKSYQAFAAPFPSVKNVTIKNLHVTGKVEGYVHSAGLIGHVGSYSTNYVENVRVSVAIETNGAYVGGFLGHGETGTYNTFTNCLFDGDAKGSGSGRFGFISGWDSDGIGTSAYNCLMHGNFTNFQYWDMCFSPYGSAIAGGFGNNNITILNNWTYKYGENTMYMIGNLSDEGLVAKLGNGWAIENAEIVPIMKKTQITDLQGGIYTNSTSTVQMAAQLGSGWEEKDNSLYYKLTSEDVKDLYDTQIWDKRARMQLRINMHGKNGVESRIVDLSDNEDAITKHQFKQELTRKYVDYSFDIIARRGSSPMRFLETDADSIVIPVRKIDREELQNYRFESNNLITKLEANKKQSSVELVWETSGGDLDYYRVLRRKHTDDANAAWTDTVARKLDTKYFEDKTVLVQQAYDYSVESIYECEGTNINRSIVSGVGCETTGKIEGYVRMADGTALSGIKVICTPGSTIMEADKEYVAYTDNAGYFVFRGLPYQANGTYNVSIPSTDIGAFTSPNNGGVVNFTQSTNWKEDFNFYLDTYYVYSGNIYYRDTSIPVPGVSFKLDGNVMLDASKQVITTDTQGAFTLSIPRGTHSVQAVKNGHIFADDGFLINRDAETPDKRTAYNFVKNVASVTLWDSTKVMLRGRVVGGDVQGDKPLGQSLSRNNLGDSLKIVMQLEGDNTSWLIRKQNDDNVHTDDYIVTFGAEGNDTARVNVTRHAMTIRPDNKTGEYQLMVPPVKYKVIEVSANGYATLFQQGKVGETIDLTTKVNGDVCEYNRIYHSIPTVDVKQFNAKDEPYFGTKTTTATDNIGNNAVVQLWGYRKNTVNDTVTDSTAVYSLGYPVFMAGSPYGWMLQACEKYYWNNKQTAQPDIVNLHHGTVSIKNYLVSTEESNAATNIVLDSLGYGSYVFTPANTTNVLTGNDALKSVDITLKYDGNYYDVKPLDGKLMRGYVMATTPKAEGAYTVAASYPRLVDILRDPPGNGSYSYLEAGSKLSYTYSPTFEGTAGISMTQSSGTYTTIYTGAVAVTPATGAGNESGTITETKADKKFAFTLASTYNGSWTTSYNIDVTERIQTKTGQRWVAGMADIFMGTNEQLIVQDAIAVRAIPEKQYQLMKTHEGGSFQVTSKEGVNTTVKVKVGSMKVLAEGMDVNGEKVYLVRDEVMGVGNKVQSTFVHTQTYIEDELLPQLAKMRNSLIMPKDSVSEQEAQSIADSKREPVYVSLTALGSPFFGCTDSVKVYYPKNPKGENVNQVQDLNQQMSYWIDMLAQNEMEKLNVQSNNLVKNYDIDGGVGSLQYSESFSASRNKSGFIKWPGLNNANIASLFPSWALPVIKKFSEEGNDASVIRSDENNAMTVQSATPAKGFTFKFVPILNFSFQDKSGENMTQAKKVGFTLSTAHKSSLNVDVYRTRNGQYSISEEDYRDKDGVVYDEMLNMTAEVLDELKYGQPYHPDSDIDVYSNFVFRTRGGVTNQPYEGERRTKWYQPGTVLDVATTPIDKPNIWVEQAVVSNVPFDEPARFVLHMANESDYPDQATIIMQYFLGSSSNPKGAKVCVDGKPLTTSGETVSFYPIFDTKTGKHNVITKEITVYPSTSYDYENLEICLKDPEDNSRVYSVNFSAHFIPSAGKVNVSMPGNNWVMNTESPYDGKRKGWYMPVRIDGFDVNFPNFDHIELQYKLSNQGDKDWVSTCSYYADKKLLAKASGVTDTIPSDGIIVARFYGENDPVEQYYDIRAVNYCRYAGGFLTKSSPILKGIKDTRLPELFGTPAPLNGILGIGDDLKMTFSEPIAGNYLSKINNFELLGTPVSKDISTLTSLHFDGITSMAFTNGTRNLTGKDFTVDVMLNPASEKRDMTIFRHGGVENGLYFGISADRHLTATINKQTVVSDSVVPFNGILRDVSYALEHLSDSVRIHFFDGSKSIGTKTIAGKHEGSSLLMIGGEFSEADRNYKGEMLEFRLWNRAMKSSSIDMYRMKNLTGYESGLLDYYPMNEGKGSFCYDKAPASMDVHLFATSWKSPEGLSIKMDGTTGLRLAPDKFIRSNEHDYTLMFWVRTYDRVASFFSTGDATAATKEAGLRDQINIGTDNYNLYVRSDGWEKNTDYFISDFEWHHVALTVSRSRNVANLYVDSKLIESFPADSIQGISGDHVALGSTFVDKNTQKNVMTGNIDEVGMYSSVLPISLISELATHTPDGRMSSLMAYLSFERSERQDDNTMHLEPTGVSLKRYKDNQGNVVERVDTLVNLSSLTDMIDRSNYAPILSKTQLDNISFSYVASGNQLLVNIKEPAYAIEKTNVYLTVKELPDLQGNLLASPVMMNAFVYRNPLRWDRKNITSNIRYGEGLSMDVVIHNLSGQRQNYELGDLPLWVSASKTSGFINALDEEVITLTVSPYINIGTYNEQITLNGDNGMSEPLPLTLNVRGDEPEWAVSDSLKNLHTMMMVARVKIDGVVANDTDDILAAFNDRMQVVGVAHVEVNNTANANEALVYINIYGNSSDSNHDELNFKFFDASTGKIYTLKTSDDKPITFTKDRILGSATSPVVLADMFNNVQMLKLKKGWNWVTFNVLPMDMTISEFLCHNTKWDVGDKIVYVNGTTTKQWEYVQDSQSRSYTWTGDSIIDEQYMSAMFMVYSMSDKNVCLEGFPNISILTIHKNWNRIGYLTTINLPIEQAMSNYMEHASEGDIIKSQDAFAIASRTSSGLVWKGSLKYMEYGKGYMLKRLADDEVMLDFPYFYGENRYSGNVSSVRRRTIHSATTMNVVASVSGVDVEYGDCLTVYNSTGKVAEVEMNEDNLFYLSVGCDEKLSGALHFTIERDGEVIAVTPSNIRYAANNVLGTPDKPTDISFVNLEQTAHDGRWYTISGILLPKKPVSSGLYIHNGKVVKL